MTGKSIASIASARRSQSAVPHWLPFGKKGIRLLEKIRWLKTDNGNKQSGAGYLLGISAIALLRDQLPLLKPEFNIGILRLQAGTQPYGWPQGITKNHADMLPRDRRLVIGISDGPSRASAKHLPSMLHPLKPRRTDAPIRTFEKASSYQ